MSSVQRKRVLIAAAICLLLAVIGTAFYFIFAEPMIRAGYEGRSFSFLNEKIAAHRNAKPELRDLQYYLDRGNWLYAWGVLACIFGFLVAAALILKRQTRGLLTNYFTATSHPLNLAVFRIVIFTFAATQFSRAHLLRYSKLPEVFLAPPTGMDWLLERVPPTPELVSVIYPLFFAACILAASGLLTRVSAVTALVLGIYVLGIPNFYGKVDHYQHIIWFIALLAVSPCADALSVDALVRRWRTGYLARPEPRLSYALPLRFIWLLIGLCYFFPGLWKIGHTGFAWIFSDNFQNILYRQWTDGNYIPGLRLDQIPFLTQASAAVAVVFELSFVFLILFPKLRPFAALSGFAFHNVTGYLMRIRFLPLQIAYVAFINWHWLFTKLGRQLFKEEGVLVFDSEHSRLVRLIAALRVLDLLERVTYLDKRTALETRNLSSKASLLFTTSHKQETEFDALMALSARVIGLWPLLPFLYLGRKPLSQIVLTYQTARPDVGKTDGVNAGVVTKQDTAAPPLFTRTWRPVALVGTFLFAGNLVFGFLNIGHGWPFAAYPTFEGVEQPTVTRYQIVKLQEGKEMPVDLTPFMKGYSEHWFETLMFEAIFAEGAAVQRVRFEDIWRFIVNELNDVDPSSTGRIYSTLIRIDPAYRDDDIVKRELLAEFNPKDVAQSAAPLR